MDVLGELDHLCATQIAVVMANDLCAPSRNMQAGRVSGNMYSNHLRFLSDPITDRESMVDSRCDTHGSASSSYGLDSSRAQVTDLAIYKSTSGEPTK